MVLIVQHIGKAEARVCGGIVRIDLDRPPETGGCLIEHLTIPLDPIDELATLQKEIMGVHVLRSAIDYQRSFRLAECHLQRSHDLLCDVVLDLENVREFTVVSLGPEMSSARTVDQLRGDANPVAGLSD